ncbi:hypothetical protein RCXUPER_169 [Rhodobacter phage RcXuper]|nr:hypothetical protein RCXUPER_169 [Rhodobacter phage RcXuper]
MAKWKVPDEVPGTEYFGTDGGEDTVTISRAELDKLRADSEMLAALEAAGVDNWEGYSIACREVMGDEEDEDE